MLRCITCSPLILGAWISGALLPGCSGTEETEPADSATSSSSPEPVNAGGAAAPDVSSPLASAGSAAGGAPAQPAPTGSDPKGGAAGAAQMSGGGGAGGATDPVGGQAGADGVGGEGGLGGAAGTGGSGQAPFPENVTPPVSDASSSLPVANPGRGYEVEGNLPYGNLPRQRLDVMYPTGEGPEATTSRPGVLMFHGGGWIQGDKATMSSFYSRFLNHGFVVASVEYRVANGSADGGIAPAAVEDALLAAKWFWDHLDYYHVDRERYVVTGASAGGHLALMVGMATPAAMLGPTHPADFTLAAIVNGYGPADVADLLDRRTSFAVQWLPADTPDRDALALRVSPSTYVRQDIPPLLTVHGSNDSTVPVAQSEALDDALKAAGADAVLHLVQGAGHGFGSPASAWPDAEATIFEFLRERGIGE